MFRKVGQGFLWLAQQGLGHPCLSVISLPLPSSFVLCPFIKNPILTFLAVVTHQPCVLSSTLSGGGGGTQQGDRCPS